MKSKDERGCYSALTSPLHNRGEYATFPKDVPSPRQMGAPRWWVPQAVGRCDCCEDRDSGICREPGSDRMLCIGCAIKPPQPEPVDPYAD